MKSSIPFSDGSCASGWDESPLVTVVTVVFNIVKSGREAFFRQCLESVHAQDYGAIEHLVIDGGSTDGTRELIAEYEGKGWVSCLSEPDEGIYDAMNKGLRLAKGRYIAFLNSDDYWHAPSGVEASVRRLEATGAAFSYAPCRVIRENGQYVSTREPELGCFICEMPFCHQTMLTRTDLMRQLGGFDAVNYRIIADFDLVTRILLGGENAVYVPCNFTSYRLGGLSNAREDEQRRKEILTVYERHYASLVGGSPESPIGKHNLPVRLISSLVSCLHPGIFALVCRFALAAPNLAPVQVVPDGLRATKWKGIFGLPLLTRIDDSGRGRRSWKLFDCLPLVSISDNRHSGSLSLKSTYRLLGFLPVWKVKTLPCVSRKHYLFGFIPFASVKQQG